MTRISAVECFAELPGNQICLSSHFRISSQSLPKGVFSSEKAGCASLAFTFSIVGLFDWKKDRKFFARFEEPVSPERESPTEDSEFSMHPVVSSKLLHVSFVPELLHFHPFACSAQC